MFVALDLPPAARTVIAAWCEAPTAGREELQAVAPEALHVTLVFLGWQDEGAAEGIAAAAFEGAAGTPPPVLRPAGVKAVPPRAARLLALDLKDEGGRAGELHARVSSALEALGIYRPETRPFWTHITLARVRRGKRAPARFTLTTQEVSNVNLALPSTPFETSELTLYRSTLRPQGALYEPLARVTLGAG